MSKFKKGDRVRCIEDAAENVTPGSLGTVIENDESSPDVCWDDYNYDWCMEEDEIELVTDKPKRKFKVGDKVRVVKWSQNAIPPGTELTLLKKNKDGDGFRTTGYGAIKERIYIPHMDEVELIEESQEGAPSPFIVKCETKEEWDAVQKKTFENGYKWEVGGATIHSFTHTNRGPHGRGIADYMEEARIAFNSYKKPKRTIMQRLTAALKRRFSKSDRTLYRAGFFNQDLTLTDEGLASLEALLVETHIKELVIEAQEVIDEEEKD